MKWNVKHDHVSCICSSVVVRMRKVRSAYGMYGMDYVDKR
jgi:hypothetical protein